MQTHDWVRLCARWTRLVFGQHTGTLTPRIRSMRLLEEVLELAQAEDVTRQEAIIILEQVYDKPRGMARMEFGGVLVTAAAYAGVRGYDIHECFMNEFERIMDPAIMERVRTRNLGGDKLV